MRHVAILAAIMMVAVTLQPLAPAPTATESRYGSMTDALGGHPWLDQADGIVEALERNAHKLPSPEAFRARLQHAAPDGSLRVVVTLGDGGDELLQTHPGAVRLGESPHAVAWLTPTQLRDWLDDPDVLHIEPDFQLEFASARTAVGTHARQREMEFETRFEDTKPTGVDRWVPKADWFTHRPTPTPVATVEHDGTEKHWKHDTWGSATAGAHLEWNRFDLCHGGQMELRFRWDSFAGSDSGFMLGGNPEGGAPILVGPWAHQQGFRIVASPTGAEETTVRAGIRGSDSYVEVDLDDIETGEWYEFTIKDIDCAEGSATFKLDAGEDVVVDGAGSVAEASWLRVGGGMAADVKLSPGVDHTTHEGASGATLVLASDDDHARLPRESSWVAAAGFPLPGGVAVNDVTIGFEAKRETGTQPDPIVRLSYTLTDGTPPAETAGATEMRHSITSLEDEVYTTAITPDQNWIRSDIPKIKVRVEHEGGAAALIDHVFVHVTYTRTETPEGPLYVDDLRLTNVPSPAAAWTYDADRLSSTIDGRPAFTGKRATVAIIDGGIDQTHPDFFEWCTPEQPIPDVSVSLDAMLPDGECKSRIKAAVTVSPLAHATGLQEQSSPAPLVNEGRLLPTTESFYSHGTHVAGIVAGNGYLSRQLENEDRVEAYGGDGFVFGMAPEAQIVSVSMGNAEEDSFPLNDDRPYVPWYSVAVAALQWTADSADDLGINAVLAAWTCKPSPQGRCPDGFPQYPTAYDQLVRALYHAGIVVVVPTGNDGPAAGADPALRFSPFATNPYVVAVGSEGVRTPTRPHLLADYSPPGDPGAPTSPRDWDAALENALRRPDITAPGGTSADGVWAARPILYSSAGRTATHDPRIVDDAYVEQVGSSMAAAHVAGAAAVLFDACPSATALEVMRALKVGAEKNMEDWALPGTPGSEPGPERRGYGPLSVRYSLDWLLEARGDCVTAEAQNEIPVLGRLDVHANYPLRVDEEVSLQLEARDRDGMITSWVIDWGTGKGDPEEPPDGPSSASVIAAQHTYTDPGSYIITVRVHDDGDQDDPDDEGVAVIRERVQVLPSLERLDSPFVIASNDDLEAFCDDVEACALECDETECLLENVEIPFNPAVHGAAVRISGTSVPITIRNAVIVVDAVVEGALPGAEAREDPESYVGDVGAWAEEGAGGVGGAAEQGVDDVTGELEEEEPDPAAVVGAAGQVVDAVENAADGVPQPASVSDASNAPRLGPAGPESFGVWISGSENVRLENVVVCPRGEAEPRLAAGFLIESSTGADLVGVGACGNMDGIRIEASSGSEIADCFVADNDRGIYVTGAADGDTLRDSEDNDLTGCLIQDNGVGIEFAGEVAPDDDDPGRGAVRDATVSGNRFRANGLHARDGNGPVDNAWNAEPRPVDPGDATATVMRVPVTGGNWWDDYQGHDATCAVCPRGPGRPDGLGDTPYHGIEGNKDDHPMVHWAGPVAVLQARLGDNDVRSIDEFGTDNIVVPPGSQIKLESLSWDPDGDETVQWDRDDEEPLPEKLNSDASKSLSWGRYTGHLTVTDNTGRLQHSRPVHVLADTAPEITTLTVQNAAQKGIVDVSVDVNDPDIAEHGDAVTIEWECGEAGIFWPKRMGDNSEGQCRFLVVGEYTITVIVRDSLGAQTNKAEVVDVGTTGAPQDVGFTVTSHGDAEEHLTQEMIRFHDDTKYAGQKGLEWHWDFGDNTPPEVLRQEDLGTCILGTTPPTCDGRHATHTYSKAGDYTVKLTIVWNGEPLPPVTKPITIQNRVPVVASLVASAEQGEPPNELTFEISVIDLDGEIVEMSLDFGDDSPVEEWTGGRAQEAVWEVFHTYAEVNEYTAVLTMIDDDGGVTVTEYVVNIQTTPPVAAFTWLGEGGDIYTEDCVRFDGSDSYDPDTAIDDAVVAWFWDFGDDATGQGQEVEHCYALPRTYTVTLVVEDTHGASHQITKDITILNVNPEPAFTWWPPFPTTVSEVFFTDQSTDHDDGIVQWTWDFGDGTTQFVVLDGCEAVGDLSCPDEPTLCVPSTEDPCPERHVTHSYTGQEPGEFQVTLTVRDASGEMQELALDLVLANAAPTGVSFTVHPQSPWTQEQVQFTGSAQDPDGDDERLEWSWDFGDDSSSDQQSPTHVYARGGEYRVRLIVTDEDKTQASWAQWVTIKNRAPTVSFDIDPATPMLDEEIAFVPDVIDPEGQEILSWSWDFGDGAASNAASPTHSYGSLGTYEVKLTVIDADGAITHATKDIAIGNVDPTGAFTANTTTPWTLSPVQFTPTIEDADGSIVSWDWRFGDGTRSRDRAPVHAYSDDGEYTVTLTATDDADGTVHSSMKIQVQNRAPEPRIDIDPAAPLAGQEVFIAGIAHDLDGRVVGWQWDLGDGNTSTQRTLLHSFPAGTYTITLTATDDDGAEGEATRSLVVGTPPEQAVLDYEADGKVVRFKAPTATGSHHWDFGDGNTSTEADPTHTYAQKGAYVVTVTVTGASVQSATSVVVVEGQPAQMPPVPSDESAPTPAFLIILALLFVLRRRPR